MTRAHGAMVGSYGAMVGTHGAMVGSYGAMVVEVHLDPIWLRVVSGGTNGGTAPVSRWGP